MRLSELKTGEKGVIVKVLGHGGFRKRIVEMGFIRGKIVTVLLNAPLQDPVKYKIMGYEISLRHSEAAMIEIMSADEARRLEDEEAEKLGLTEVSEKDSDDEGFITDEQLHKAAMKKSRTINVALVGNPNCGKTSLFNFASGAHERVGNYSGVTVDAKEGKAEYGGYTFNLVDLPGTYSLSAYSPEELYVRKQIIENTPDVIINVIDASNLERNLYLTAQLVDMNLKIVGALNMFDEFESRGDKLDYDKLGELFGIPLVPTVFKNGRGVDDLFNMVINVYEGEGAQGNSLQRHVHLNHGKYIEQAINKIKKEIQKDEQIRYKYSTRFLSIKLLEKDSKVEEFVKTLPNGGEIIATRDKAAEYIMMETKEDSETAIMNAKYGIIHGALQEAGCEEGSHADTYQTTHILDALVTNKYVGFPLFFLFLYIARRPAERHDSRRRHSRRRGGDSVPAANPHPVCLHLVHGRLRLHGPRGLHHGQADAQDGSARQIIHTADNGLRVQRSRHYGHPHDREPPQPAHHNPRIAADELQRATAYLHHDNGHVLRR